MPPTTALDLPWEILSVIIADSAPTGDESVKSLFGMKRSHYSKLSRVCRAMHSFFTPLIWTNVYIDTVQTLTKLHTVLLSSPEAAQRIQKLKFRASWALPENCYLEDMEHVMSMHGRNSTTAVVTQGVLDTLINLQSLDITPVFQRDCDAVVWSFDLRNNQKLEVLHIQFYRCSPQHVNEFLSLPCLMDLCLDDTLREDDWALPAELPSQMTNAKKLSLLGTLFGFRRTLGWPAAADMYVVGVPNRISQSFLSCFQSIENLTLTVPADACCLQELDKMLIGLAERTKLRSLHLQARDPLSDGYEEGRLQIDFSTWQYLTELEFDSHILWPIEDSWALRNNLYRILPSSLRILTIHFPQDLNILRDYIPVAKFDGIFQTNINYTLSIFKDEPEWLEAQNQIIPSTRYTWVLNLLSQSTAEYGRTEYLLPELSKISLREDGFVGKELSERLGQSTAPFSLPEEMASMFRARSIELEVDAIIYPEQSVYSERESQDLDYFGDHDDLQDGEIHSDASESNP